MKPASPPSSLLLASLLLPFLQAYGGVKMVSKTLPRYGQRGPIEYWVGFVNRAISSQPPTTIEPGETESILRLAASASAELGTSPLVVVARSLEGAIHRSMGAGD